MGEEWRCEGWGEGAEMPRGVQLKAVLWKYGGEERRCEGVGKGSGEVRGRERERRGKGSGDATRGSAAAEAAAAEAADMEAEAEAAEAEAEPVVWGRGGVVRGRGGGEEQKCQPAGHDGRGRPLAGCCTDPAARAASHVDRPCNFCPCPDRVAALRLSPPAMLECPVTLFQSPPFE
eukprot:147664-Chlamydomonas_euryale.AAC.1